MLIVEIYHQNESTRCKGSGFPTDGICSVFSIISHTRLFPNFIAPKLRILRYILSRSSISGEGLTNITSVVESGLGLPSPEELARYQPDEGSSNAAEVTRPHCTFFFNIIITVSSFQIKKKMNFFVPNNELTFSGEQYWCHIIWQTFCGLWDQCGNRVTGCAGSTWQEDIRKIDRTRTGYFSLVQFSFLVHQARMPCVRV